MTFVCLISNANVSKLFCILGLLLFASVVLIEVYDGEKEETFINKEEDGEKKEKER